MKLKFRKYEGTGNDFIMIDGRGGKVGGGGEGELTADAIRYLCDRHRGIGADGLMVLTDQAGFDFRMRYFNADGGEADTCGNGGRCITLFAHHLGIGTGTKTFAGRDGGHHARILSQCGTAAAIELGMIDVGTVGRCGDGFHLNTGVPHYIEFVEDVSVVDVGASGRPIRRDGKFAAGGGTNVDFVEIAAEGVIRARTYERGVEGETLACGTGAVAAAIATHVYKQGSVSRFTVRMPGGELGVSFTARGDGSFGGVTLTGQARQVFEGEAELPPEDNPEYFYC